MNFNFPGAQLSVASFAVRPSSVSVWKRTSAASRLAAGSLHATDALPRSDRLLMPAQRALQVQRASHKNKDASRGER
jgi:hypothetical protein